MRVYPLRSGGIRLVRRLLWGERRRRAESRSAFEHGGQEEELSMCSTRRTLSGSSILALSLLALTARGAAAQEESRALATHRYIPPLLQQPAFITTHFGVREGVTSLIVPDAPLELGTDELRALGFTQAIDLGVKITDYVGLYGTASGSVTSGIDAGSAFEVGADLEGAFELGAVLRLARFEPIGTEISLRFSGGMQLANGFDVAQFIEAVEEATTQSVAAVRRSDALALLSTPSTSRRLGGGLFVAQTLLPQLGLQASLALRQTKTTARPFDFVKRARVDETKDSLDLEAAVALSFDASSLRVPLALMPEYRLVRTKVESRDDAGEKSELTYVSHYVGIGLYYSGRENLVLGAGAVFGLNLEGDRLAWTTAEGTPRRSGAPSERQGQFVLRYVW